MRISEFLDTYVRREWRKQKINEKLGAQKLRDILLITFHIKVTAKAGYIIICYLAGSVRFVKKVDGINYLSSGLIQKTT